MAKPEAKTVAKSFEATLEPDNTALKWVIVRIPFDAAKLWGKRGRIRVKGHINGFAFKTSLFPSGDGRHTLLVNKKMQRGGQAALGTTARFRLEPDTEERVFTIPPELDRFLAEDRALRRWFDKLNQSTRDDIARSITELRSPASRARRAEQTAEHLLQTMDAERELPPILRAAFARDARAEEGWNRMTVAQRRWHLFGILGYRSPESRARRIAKMMEFARQVAGRGRGV